MLDGLVGIDRSLFTLINQGLQNPLLDAMMPVLTDSNRNPIGLAILGILWLALLLGGGRAGRIAALLLVPTIVISDQLNSSVLKFIIERPRPCHELANVHLLVGCGSGFSFPSSHAVNNFAAATVLAYFIPRWTWGFLSYAALIAFSRVYVGVHYPSDVLSGAVIGMSIAAFVLWTFRRCEEWWRAREEPKGETW